MSRKVGRRLIRLKLRAAERKLFVAETDLGLLGWQQVDFDPQTQQEVDKLQHVEREQARLTSLSAVESQTVLTLEEQLRSAQVSYDAVRAGLEGEVRALAETVEQLNAKLALARKQEPEFEKQLPALDQEFIEVERRHGELYDGDRRKPEIRDELIRLRERKIAIPNAKIDLRRAHTIHLNGMKELEAGLARCGRTSEQLQARLQQAEAEFAATAAQIDLEIKSAKKRKAEIDAESAALEGGKTTPYRQIGRVLANYRIAPMNQPHALEKVLLCRRNIEALQARLDASNELSAALDPSTLQRSYLCLAGVFALVATLIFLIF